MKPPTTMLSNTPSYSNVWSKAPVGQSSELKHRLLETVIKSDEDKWDCIYHLHVIMWSCILSSRDRCMMYVRTYVRTYVCACMHACIMHVCMYSQDVTSFYSESALVKWHKCSNMFHSIESVYTICFCIGPEIPPCTPTSCLSTGSGICRRSRSGLKCEYDGCFTEGMLVSVRVPKTA